MVSNASDFMSDLMSKLSEKKLSEKSKELYIKYLIMLNDGPFKNLSFLKNKENIEKKLEKYSENTKKTILGAIVSILSLYKDKPVYKPVYLYYQSKMNNKIDDVKKNIDTNEKSSTQKENWIEWDHIIALKNDMKLKINDFINNKLITTKQFNQLLSYMILSLYTDIAPRRNNDYLEMYVIKNKNESKELDKNKNYLDLTNKEFIFNNYKTQKKYGQQIVNLTDDLFNSVLLYLKHHPLNPSKKDPLKLKKGSEYKFLVFSDGSNFNAPNAITRILNKIFNKKVGSSMLRHIYLSSKYNIDEMKKDAENMGHSLETQKEYMKVSKKKADVKKIELVDNNTDDEI